jgi:signal transduction histidine kinase/CheY-like chemotaxis protein
MRRWQALFDDHFEAVGRFDVRTLALRLLSAIVTVVLLGLAVSPSLAAGWLFAYLCAEAWCFAASRPMQRGRSGTPLQRLHLGLAALGAICVWTAVAVIYWMTGSPGLQFVATCILAGVLISGPPLSARSLTMFGIITAPPLAAMVILPVFFSTFHGVALFMVFTSIALIALHLAVSVSVYRRAMSDLESSRREAVAANLAKSAFLAMMSHEIRTPMNGVLGMAHALAQSPLNDDQRRQVDMLTRSGDGLMTILNDILDLSKIETGKLTLEETVFDLHEVVRCVEELWKASAEAKGLVLVSEIETTAPQWVMGDPTRVRQILLNHVSNAVKFTEAGSVHVLVAGNGPDGIVITVRDTGIGLTAEQIDGLFQAFSQADASTARRFGGTGLGLSISRQLANLMGGDVAVDSAPDVGSEFTISLHLPAAPAPAQSAEPEQPAISLAGLRVLVAEDNLINQAVVQAVLAATEMVVDVAGDGEEALRQLRLDDYDVVLMDVHMPNMDGLEALRRIRAGEAGRPDQLVIALTADAMAGDAQRFIALGFDAVESKPIQPTELIACIADVCGSAKRGGRRRDESHAQKYAALMG